MQKRRLDEDNAEESSFCREEESLEKIYESCIKSFRLLQEKEFVSIFPPTYKYDEYFEKYYNVNLKEFFASKCNEQAWVSEMDLSRKSSTYEFFMEFRDFIASKSCPILLSDENAINLLNTDLFDEYVCRDEEKDKMYVVLKNIDMKCTIREFTESLNANAMVKEWRISQHGISESFKRTMYIRIEEDVSHVEFRENIKNMIPKGSILVSQCFPIKALASVRIVGKQLSDKYCMERVGKGCKQILCEMASMFGMNEIFETVQGFEQRYNKQEITDMYIIALRKIFNYCYYCKEKFGNPYEMMSKCGIFHVRSKKQIDMASIGSLERASSFYSLTRAVHFQAMNRPVDIRVFSKERRDRSEYECKYCDKKFTTLEYFKKHLEKKNHPEQNVYESLYNNFISALSSLDYPLIEMIEQRGQLLPNYLYRYWVHEDKDKSLVCYGDMDKKYPILFFQPPISIVDSGTED